MKRTRKFLPFFFKNKQMLNMLRLVDKGEINNHLTENGNEQICRIRQNIHRDFFDILFI
jgi:hypothetical protein